MMNAAAIQPIITFRGYNPAATTIVGPQPARGSCLGDAFPDGASIWFDPAVQPYSGDVVILAMRLADGSIQRLGKELQCTRDGAWWGICNRGVMAIDLLGVEQVAPVVAKQLPPPGTLPGPDFDPLPRGLQQYMADLSRDAIAEWQTRGFPPRTAYRRTRAGIEAAASHERAAICRRFQPGQTRERALRMSADGLARLIARAA